jgi:hypothetical protein
MHAHISRRGIKREWKYLAMNCDVIYAVKNAVTKRGENAYAKLTVHLKMHFGSTVLSLT